MTAPQTRDQRKVLTVLHEFGPLPAERVGYALDIRTGTAHRIIRELWDHFLVRETDYGWCSEPGWSPWDLT